MRAAGQRRQLDDGRVAVREGPGSVSWRAGRRARRPGDTSIAGSRPSGASIVPASSGITPSPWRGRCGLHLVGVERARIASWIAACFATRRARRVARSSRCTGRGAPRGPRLIGASAGVREQAVERRCHGGTRRSDARACRTACRRRRGRFFVADRERHRSRCERAGGKRGEIHREHVAGARPVGDLADARADRDGAGRDQRADSHRPARRRGAPSRHRRGARRARR